MCFDIQELFINYRDRVFVYFEQTFPSSTLDNRIFLPCYSRERLSDKVYKVGIRICAPSVVVVSYVPEWMFTERPSAHMPFTEHMEVSVQCTK